jgi:hypothetical protein
VHGALHRTWSQYPRTGSCLWVASNVEQEGTQGIFSVLEWGHWCMMRDQRHWRLLIGWTHSDDEGFFSSCPTSPVSTTIFRAFPPTSSSPLYMAYANLALLNKTRSLFDDALPSTAVIRLSSDMLHSLSNCMGLLYSPSSALEASIWTTITGSTEI